MVEHVLLRLARASLSLRNGRGGRDYIRMLPSDPRECGDGRILLSDRYSIDSHELGAGGGDHRVVHRGAWVQYLLSATGRVPDHIRSTELGGAVLVPGDLHCRQRTC